MWVYVYECMHVYTSAFALPVTQPNVASAVAGVGAVICHLHLSPVCRMICLSLTSRVCVGLWPRARPADTVSTADAWPTATGVHIGLLFHYRKMFSTRRLLVIFPSSDDDTTTTTTALDYPFVCIHCPVCIPVPETLPPRLLFSQDYFPTLSQRC